MSITSMEDLKNKQAEVKKNLDGYTCRVLVCSGTGCIASGAQKIYEEMSRLCEGIEGVAVEMQKDVPHVGIVKTGCQGLCELGPLMRIEFDPAHPERNTPESFIEANAGADNSTENALNAGIHMIISMFMFR